MKIPMTVSHLLSTINGNVHALGVHDGVLQLRDLIIDPRMQIQLDDINKAIDVDDGVYKRGSDVVSELHGVQCGLEHLRLCWRNVGDAGSLVGPMKVAIAAMQPEPTPEPEPEPKTNSRRGPCKKT